VAFRASTSDCGGLGIRLVLSPRCRDDRGKKADARLKATTKRRQIPGKQRLESPYLAFAALLPHERVLSQQQYRTSTKNIAINTFMHLLELRDHVLLFANDGTNVGLPAVHYKIISQRWMPESDALAAHPLV
jgi:hypothetical protein